MTTTEQALQGVRLALKSASGWADARVLVSGSGSLGASQSYFTVLVASKQSPELPDVLLSNNADPDLVTVSSRQRSTVFVTIQGHGQDTEPILSKFVRECRTTYGIGATLATAGVAVYAVTGPANIVSAGDTTAVPRWRVTLDAYVSETASIGTVGVLETVDVDLDLTAATGDVETTIDLTYTGS